MKNIFDPRKWYDKNAPVFASLWGDIPNPDFENFCSLLDPNGRVADIACGSGRDLKSTHRPDLVLIGSDISKAQAKNSRQFSSLVLVADFTKLPYPDNSFDAIWANAAVVHSSHSQTVAVFAECLRITKPGALMYVSVKTRDETVGKDGFDKQNRLFFIRDQNQIKNQLEEAGWEILNQQLSDDYLRDYVTWTKSLARNPL